MTDLRQTPRAVDVAEAGRCLAALVDEVAERKGRIVVRRDDKPVAALISAADLERLESLDRLRAEHWAFIQEIQARNADKDPDEVERDVAEAIAEARAEARAEKLAKSRT
jgi:prevent-host-death family protein